MLHQPYRTRAACLPLLLALSLLYPSLARPAGAVLRYHWVLGAHTSQTETDTTTTTLHVTPPIGTNDTTTRIDHFTTTQTVRKVYTDGSGLVRSTFTNYSTSTGHKATAYSLKGFAVDQRISPVGVLMSQTLVGTFAPEADPPNGIVSPIPTRYAAGPVAVGGVWHQTENDGSGSGDVVAAYRVRAFGSWHGRPTVSLATTIDQPFRTNGLLPLTGTYVGHASETVVVADGALVAPSHATFAVSGTVDGTLNGKKARGTVVISSTQDVTPEP